MEPQELKNKAILFTRTQIVLGFVCLTLLFLSACSELEKPKTKEFYSETKPPRAQEFRWTNGQLPKSFDPAMAPAPPETDFVRALYEGLTDTESKTLKAVPAIAIEWSSSEDNRVWTFKLRNDAKWSNGKSITAEDFVRSWTRLARLGEKVHHHELLKNIVGMRSKKPKADQKAEDVFTRQSFEKTEKSGDSEKIQKEKQTGNLNSKPGEKKDEAINGYSQIEKEKAKARKLAAKKILGVKALSEFELEVSLVQPDKEFPKLVSHPVFRPVYANGEEFEKDKLNSNIVTSGAFKVTSVADDGVTLERAGQYWNKGQVKLEKVRFVPTKDADSALQLYREGKVDAVTNAQFKPLALKLLTPFIDFRRITHSALNLYEFNLQKPPFNDRRVREALAISIERKRLTEDEMDGATKPANKYLPFSSAEGKTNLDQNTKKARALMETAGFQNGENFPKVRLVINRNNVQQRIAKSVGKMWKKALNIETEIVVKEISELETAKLEGDFDLLRRGVVLPTADETANMLAIFKPTKLVGKTAGAKKGSNADSAPQKGQSESETAPVAGNDSKKGGDGSIVTKRAGADDPRTGNSDELIIDVGEDRYILTEDEALLEVPGIPLYFPTSYSLVKPYVVGFEMNTFDALSLKDVEIDSSWKPKSEKNGS